LTQPNGKVQIFTSIENMESVFRILTVRGVIADANSYGFWTDIHVQSS